MEQNVSKTPEKKYDVSVEKKSGSVVLIKGAISPDVISSHKSAALKQIGADVEMPGFRKGHVPAHIIEAKVGEIGILEEAAGIVLEKIVPEILIQESIQLITHPSIRITKLVPGNPVEYTISVPVMPTITLPDYKKVAKKLLPKKKETFDVTEVEVNEALLNVRKSVASWKQRQHAPETSHEHNHADHTHAPGEKHDHNHNSLEKENEIKKELELAPLTDDDVKMIGDYKDVADFTEKLKQSLVVEKKRKSQDKRRAEIAEALIKETKIDIPEVMVEDEQEVMLRRFRHDIEEMGMKFDAYLKELKKTEVDLKKEWQNDAKKRVTLELILAKIAQEEKLEVKPEELETEVARYLKAIEGSNENRVREHLRRMMLNEAVFKLLEE